MCARVSVGEGQTGGAHLLAGGLCGSCQCRGGGRHCGPMGGQAKSSRTLLGEADGILYGVGDGHGGSGCGVAAMAGGVVRALG
jgi:hypothetical protein